MQPSSITVGCLLAVWLAVAGPGRAEAQCGTAAVIQTITDGDGFTWDVTGTGYIQNGTGDTYDDGWVLSVNGAPVPADATPTLELGGRQVALDSTVSGVNVVRRLYVPSGAPGFARILDSFTNPTASSVTLSILMQVNMGSDGSTVIVGTSSGDTAFTTADRWVSSDDADGTGDPSNGLLFYGAGAAVVPTTASTTVFDCAGTQGYAVTYSLTLAAGETRSLMHLAVQRNNRAAIGTALTSLETAPPLEVRTGLNVAALARIANWSLAPVTLCGGTVGTTLTDGDGFLWDVQSNGAINNGTGDTYDTGWGLLVNGAAVPDDATPTLELSGRQVALDSTIGALAIARRTYVPTAAPGFARLLDSFTNTGTVPLDVTVVVQTNMGSDGATVIVGTSSGDTLFSTADRWVRNDDTDGGGDPSNGLIFWDAGAGTTPTDVTTTVFDCAGPQGYGLTYNFTIPAGQTRLLMHLAVQRNNQAGVTSAITALEGGPTTPVRTGIAPADLPRIINWNFTAVCGNGLLEGAEGCDDGNTAAGDCCSPTCTFEVAGTTCRAAAGVCDAAEACTGTSGVCPVNGFAVSGTTCRTSSGVCDVAEACTGAAAACPADGFAASGTTCRTASDVCDVAEACTGAATTCPSDGFVASGTACRAAADVCDVPEACTGGAAACPSDGFVASGTTCRASLGMCDIEEACTGMGASCPLDVLVPDGVGCTNGLVCDGAESCAAGACVDQVDPVCDDGNLCTADACTEPGGCGAVTIAGCCNLDTDCTDDGNVCTAERCGGAGGTCSALPVAGCCNVDADCTGGSTCVAVACDVATNRCAATPIPGCCTTDADCSDGIACTADTCNAATGACTNAAIDGCCVGDGDCNDADSCTADTCDLSAGGGTGTCGAAAVPLCCEVDGDCSDADGDLCTTPSCDAATQRCVERALGCDDSDPCTADACEADGTCSHTPAAACVDAGLVDADGGVLGVDAGGGAGVAGGCACRAGGRSEHGPLALGLGLALAAALARRRRR